MSIFIVDIKAAMTSGMEVRPILNAERTLIAAECIGDGYWFTDRVVKYVSARNVFGRPIGQNQGVQFPIAEAFIEGEAANPRPAEELLMAPPLSGLTIVAIEQTVAAPFISARLADAAAKVIRIERPEGDFAPGP